MNPASVRKLSPNSSQNRYLRIGFSGKGGRRVFRIGGEVVQKFKANGKIDLFDLRSEVS